MTALTDTEPSAPETAPGRATFLDRGDLALTYIAVFHGLALLAPFFPFRPIYLVPMLAYYLWMGFGISLYLHRCLAHRSLELAEPLKAFFALGVALGLMRNPIWWAGQHRVHHQKADKPGDVHSPQAGLFHAHVGWIRGASDLTLSHMRAARELRQTAYTRLFGSAGFQLGANLVIAASLVALDGPGCALWCLYVPLVLYWNVVWGINSVCHTVGYRSFDTPDESRNNRLWGFLALGEGYHNNHHARPQRARAGLSWKEPDPTSAVIWALEKVGLAQDVHWD